jgi:hypothetical protein
MQSFSIPRHSADRLARLGLACANDNTPISHIGVRVGLQAVRFSATNGRVLASLVIPVDDQQGTPGDLILDQDQFCQALKSAAKATGNRMTFKIDAQEARITNGTATAVVRRIGGAFPNVDHIWSRPAGWRWIPTMSSLDPGLVSIAQKIAGNKQPMLLASPVDPGGFLEMVWASPGKGDHAVTMLLADLRAAVTAPAYWADHELAILIMPITRSDGERQLDLSAHAMPLPQAAAAAA